MATKGYDVVWFDGTSYHLPLPVLFFKDFHNHTIIQSRIAQEIISALPTTAYEKDSLVITSYRVIYPRKGTYMTPIIIRDDNTGLLYPLMRMRINPNSIESIPEGFSIYGVCDEFINYIIEKPVMLKVRNHGRLKNTRHFPQAVKDSLKKALPEVELLL